MSQIKPGISAFIKRAHPDFADCIGRIVTVEAWHPEFHRWRISFVGSVPESVQSWHGTFGLASEHLIPIGGLPLTDDVPEEIKTEITA